MASTNYAGETPTTVRSQAKISAELDSIEGFDLNKVSGDPEPALESQHETSKVDSGAIEIPQNSVGISLLNHKKRRVEPDDNRNVRFDVKSDDLQCFYKQDLESRTKFMNELKEEVAKFTKRQSSVNFNMLKAFEGFEDRFDEKISQIEKEMNVFKRMLGELKQTMLREFRESQSEERDYSRDFDERFPRRSSSAKKSRFHQRDRRLSPFPRNDTDPRFKTPMARGSTGRSSERSEFRTTDEDPFIVANESDGGASPMYQSEPEDEIAEPETADHSTTPLTVPASSSSNAISVNSEEKSSESNKEDLHSAIKRVMVEKNRANKVFSFLDYKGMNPRPFHYRSTNRRDKSKTQRMAFIRKYYLPESNSFDAEELIQDYMGYKLPGLFPPHFDFASDDSICSGVYNAYMLFKNNLKNSVRDTVVKKHTGSLEKDWNEMIEVVSKEKRAPEGESDANDEPEADGLETSP